MCYHQPRFCQRFEDLHLAIPILSLATAFNQVGICHMNGGETEDALKNWEESVLTYRSIESPPDFSGTFPTLSLANTYVLQGRADDGEIVLKPVLEEHERILDKDDKTTTT